MRKPFEPSVLRPQLASFPVRPVHEATGGHRFPHQYFLPLLATVIPRPSLMSFRGLQARRFSFVKFTCHTHLAQTRLQGRLAWRVSPFCLTCHGNLQQNPI